MTDSDRIQLAIVHEAESWCPGCGAATTERFVELLIHLERTDRATFDRAIANIVNEIHQHEGEAQAA